MRTLVIGDIHGAYKALIQVLERSNYDKEKDKLIFLGDYVDRWPDSSKVIQHLIDLRDQTHIKPIFIMGNHDVWCEEWLNFGVSQKIWLNQGGQSTVDSYYLNSEFYEEPLLSKHRSFFNQLHHYYIDDQNRGFTHGGYISKLGLGNEHLKSNYYWDRDLWGLALLSHGRVHFDSDGYPKHCRFYKHKEVYIGHTPSTNWKCKSHLPEYKDLNQVSNGIITIPMNRCNVWNLDTGAGGVGKLSIMDIDTKEYWQSDFVKELYPEEKTKQNERT